MPFGFPRLFGQEKGDPTKSDRQVFRLSHTHTFHRHTRLDIASLSLHQIFLKCGRLRDCRPFLTLSRQVPKPWACVPEDFTADGRRRVFHGGTMGFARGAPCWGVEGLTRYWHYSDKLYRIKDNSMLQRDSMRGTKLHLK